MFLTYSKFWAFCRRAALTWVTYIICWYLLLIWAGYKYSVSFHFMDEPRQLEFPIQARTFGYQFKGFGLCTLLFTRSYLIFLVAGIHTHPFASADEEPSDCWCGRGSTVWINEIMTLMKDNIEPSELVTMSNEYGNRTQGIQYILDSISNRVLGGRIKNVVKFKSLWNYGSRSGAENGEPKSKVMRSMDLQRC